MVDVLEKNWDLDFRAELYKQELYATDAWASARHGLVDHWDASTTRELEVLRGRRREERTAHIGEIIREQQGPVLIGLWFDLLAIGPTSHPLTTELLHATIYLAGSVATCVKDRFNRVRPSVLAPDLSPPIPVPGLPAYPGGHSTQMHLMARTLRYLVPGRADEITRTADTVAVNRERAGLNYPSDTAAGEQLADHLFEILTRECALFTSTLGGAKNLEWGAGRAA
jgi:acid phosphatase (class A)